MPIKMLLAMLAFVCVWTCIMWLIVYFSPSTFEGSSAGVGLLLFTLSLVSIEQGMFLYGAL
jgi:hypothetical protein